MRKLINACSVVVALGAIVGILFLVSANIGGEGASHGEEDAGHGASVQQHVAAGNAAAVPGAH